MATSLVNNKYRITRRIGGGSFGEIYMGVGPNNEKVAVKFERHGTRCPQLRHEYKVYRELLGCHGFCQVYHFGQQDNYNVMVMDLLGPSLEDLFNKCNRRFSLKTVLQIADQMLERVDTLHSRHLIHRDIKPANFVIGLGENAANIYCVDFGLSKRYRHPKNLQHIPHRDGRSLTGTPRYASINNHLGIEQSRRDDLESIGYVLIYFLKGSLPWQGLKAKNAQKKYRLILEKKQQVSIAQLCQGCPSQFAEFLAYTRSLKFDAKPDIPYLRKLFRDLYHAQNCGSIPKLWDWDGMDNDYNSTSGSAAPPVAAPPVNPAGTSGPVPAQPGLSHLRPTTAAAVAGPGAMLGVDQDMGLTGMPDDLDDGDYDQGAHNVHNNRPNTAGALMQSYSKPTPGQVSNGQNTWGYPRQASGGVAAGAEDPNAARRPHTAHGARAGFPATSSNALPPSASSAMYAQQDPKYASESEEAHVVAGAREMMRYRRNRTTTLDAPGAGTTQGMTVNQTGSNMQSYGSANGNNWAVYQQATAGSSQMKPGNPQQTSLLSAQQQQQNMALRKAGAGVGTTAGPAPSAGNWPAYSSGHVDSRPKSATMSSGVGVGAAPGTVGARPASGSAGNGGPVSGGAQWSGAPQAASGLANNNTLSYGSLKNRLISGNTPVANAAGQPVSNKPSTSGLLGTQQGAAPSSASGTASGKSKLFSLAR